MNKIGVQDEKISINGRILTVPKHLIRKVSKILKDELGIDLNEKIEYCQNQYKRQIAQIASHLINSFRNYCKENQYSVIENELQQQLEKKRNRKIFTIHDLYELQYKNQNRQEFIDKWEAYLSLGYAEKNLMNNKKIKSEIKIELKTILNYLLFESQVKNPKQSIYCL
ncbi:unnamed protein product [Paramecium sonneborni]|uniref:Uncharacterized protein n=1 Tax=Paramecium sonneborni TaxID=65129 RepID=A0A8S1M154_9CILI|nr:unnamed protein product [Paramecium sonneborni]